MTEEDHAGAAHLTRCKLKNVQRSLRAANIIHPDFVRVVLSVLLFGTPYAPPIWIELWKSCDTPHAPPK